MVSDGRGNPVREYCDMLVSAVREAVDYGLDYSIETLPVVDHYVSLIQKDSQTRDEVVILVASMAGVYFGEVLKRRFGAEWHLHDTSDPFTWELFFTSCPLAIRPVHISYEIITRREDSAIDSSLRTAPARQKILYDYFESLGQVTEDEFFSFSGRTEILMAALDLLSEIERFIAEQEGRSPKRFGKKDPATLSLPPFDAEKYAEIYGSGVKEAMQSLMEALMNPGSGGESSGTELPVVTSIPEDSGSDEDPGGGSTL